MNKKISLIFLAIIIFIASFIRIWKLGEVPPSPNWDEVALAYDAHSLFTTGRDEYGEYLPFVLRSFDDYKPALYAYLAIPTVEIFGMNAFAVRLPSAIFGIIAIFAFYFLVKELFKKESIALLSAFLLAISPWHIQFSRIAFESNVGLTFNILTALFFIKGQKRPWMLLLAALFAGLNLSIYQSERVFTPLFVLSLVVIYWKQLFSQPKKYLIASLLIGIMSIAPLVLYISTHTEALVRVKATSIFSNQTKLLEKNIVRLTDDKKRTDFLGLALDNRRVTYISSISSGYFSHFDFNWLFIKGDINRHHAPRMGLLYLVTLPLILIGIYQLIFGKFDRRAKYFIFSWLLIAPIPASITFEVPHAVRTLNVVPVYQVLTVLGIITIYGILSKYKVTSIKHNFLKIYFYCLFFILSAFNFVYFLNQYFVQQNYFYASDWQFGYKEAIQEAEGMKNNYEKVVVSDSTPMDKSYMFFLFYLNYPPLEYQKIGRNSSGKFDSTHYFDKYDFRVFSWEKERETDDTLFIGSPNDFPSNIISRKKIYFPDGKPAILIVDPKDQK